MGRRVSARGEDLAPHVGHAEAEAVAGGVAREEGGESFPPALEGKLGGRVVGSIEPLRLDGDGGATEARLQVPDRVPHARLVGAEGPNDDFARAALPPRREGPGRFETRLGQLPVAPGEDGLGPAFDEHVGRFSGLSREWLEQPEDAGSFQWHAPGIMGERAPVWAVLRRPARL